MAQKLHSKIAHRGTETPRIVQPFSPLCLGASVCRALFFTLALATSTAAQTTLFTTKDYRQDRDRWTDPAYFVFNTARELTDMQVDTRFGQKGKGEDEYTIKSPYSFRTSEEHYQAWLKKANGGTTHTLATLPDWDGRWSAGSTWLDSRGIQASTMAAALTPQYREYYVQQVKAEAEGRHWWAAAFCLPDGFIRGLWRADQFVVRPTQVLILSDMLTSNQVRWLHTDKGHRPEAEQFPQWQGESVAFWDGNALVVHTNQIRAWNATHSLFEWSDQLTTVERYERVGNELVGEITLYDPVAFLYPLHAKLRFTRARGDDRPVFSTCTDTNGPSSNIFARPDGIVDERVAGDPGYWDPNDARPWAKHYAIGEGRR
jgi:hypothetical protein